jgi:uncharacterized membrane protein YhaH (DUF805 family)
MLALTTVTYNLALLRLPLESAGLVAIANGSFALIVCAPRFHDLGRSGWWGPAAFGLYLLGLNLTDMMPWPKSGTFPPGVAEALIFWNWLAPICFALLGVWPGQRTPNKFGPPPPRGFAIPFIRRSPPEQDVVDTFS